MRAPPAVLFSLVAACASTAAPPDERPPPSVVRVAACQLHVSGDPEDALRAIDEALAEAAREGAVLAVFPETCLFGWVNPEAHERADPIPGPTTDRLAELARRNGLMMAVGLAEKDGERLYDSAVLIDRDGRLLLRHRKVNVLGELMDPPYTPGEDARESFVDTRLGRIGLLICADTFDDEVVGQVAAAEPDLVVVPYGWAAPAGDWPEHGESLRDWVAFTAKRVGAPVVGVDATGTIGHGPWKGYLFGGQSVVCRQDGSVLGVLADREQQVTVLEVVLAGQSGTSSQSTTAEQRSPSVPSHSTRHIPPGSGSTSMISQSSPPQQSSIEQRSAPSR